MFIQFILHQLPLLCSRDDNRSLARLLTPSLLPVVIVPILGSALDGYADDRLERLTLLHDASESREDGLRDSREDIGSSRVGFQAKSV